MGWNVIYVEDDKIDEVDDEQHHLFIVIEYDDAQLFFSEMLDDEEEGVVALNVWLDDDEVELDDEVEIYEMDVI